MKHKAAFFSMFSLGLRFMTGPISIFFITSELSQIEQSIYYTFISIAAIQWVFELGVSTCIIQKMASLKINRNVNAVIKIGSIFFFAVSIILFFILFLYAEWILSSTSITWRGPWGLYSFFICVNIFNNILLIIEEGKVNPEKVYKVKLFGSVFYALSLILSLYFGLKLYSLGIAQFSMFFIVLISLYKNYKLVFKSIFDNNILRCISIFKKMMAFQIKLSLVWITGYLYWNFYTIYFYKYVNEILAGQFGATNAIISAIALGMASWLQTKRAYLGKLNSNGKYKETVKVFLNSSSIAIFLYVIICFIVIYAYNYLPAEYSKRFLNVELICQIMILRLVILFQELMLIYLRTFNDEPLYKITIFNYIITPVFIVLPYLMNDGDNVFLYSIIVQVVFLCMYMYYMARYLIFKYKREYSNV